MSWPYRIVAILLIALPVKPLIAAEDHDPSRLTVAADLRRRRVRARACVGPLAGRLFGLSDARNVKGEHRRPGPGAVTTRRPAATKRARFRGRFADSAR